MAGSTNTPTALLSMEGVSKSFGAVVALNDATLQLPTGKITGLVGDNGAGKSTLIKIISGVLTPNSGSIEFLGKPANFASPADARERGVETVYQDLALAGNLAVWANLYLGRELTVGPKFLHVLDKRSHALEDKRDAQPVHTQCAANRGAGRIAVRRAAAGGGDCARRSLGVETHSHG